MRVFKDGEQERQLTSGSASGITSGAQAVAVAGTAEQLVASSTPCVAVQLMHDDANTGSKGYVGASNVDTTNGITLFKGALVTIEIDDASKLYVDVDTSGDSIKYNILTV